MSKFCPRCGTQVQDDANFCMKCGYNYNGAQTVAAQTQSKQASAASRAWVQNSGVVNPYPVAGYEEYNPTFHCRCEYSAINTSRSSASIATI